MGAGYFIIAILGCADGAAVCEPVAMPPVRYESEQACQAAAPDALMANSDLDFPMLFAECRPVAPKASSATQPEPPPAGSAAA